MAEVFRGVRRSAITNPGADLSAWLRKAAILLEEVALHPIERGTLRRAGTLFEPRLRSLDAIHVAAALELRPIEAFVSYDKRQLKAARRAGLPTVSPRA